MGKFIRDVKGSSWQSYRKYHFLPMTSFKWITGIRGWDIQEHPKVTDPLKDLAPDSDSQPCPSDDSSLDQKIIKYNGTILLQF
jgi:hypothetical protein